MIPQRLWSQFTTFTPSSCFFKPQVQTQKSPLYTVQYHQIPLKHIIHEQILLVFVAILSSSSSFFFFFCLFFITEQTWMGFKIPIPWTNINGFQNTHYLFIFLYCTSQNLFLWRNVTHLTNNSQMVLSLSLRPMRRRRARLGHWWPSLEPPMLRQRSVGRRSEISDLTRSSFVVDPKGKKKRIYEMIVFMFVFVVDSALLGLCFD